MKNKWWYAFVCMELCFGIAISSCMVTGCSNPSKELVDYPMDSETNSDKQQSGDGNRDWLGKGAANPWEEKLVTSRENGSEVTVQIKAKIHEPKMEQMYVCSVREPDFSDEAFKEAFLTGIFTGTDIYDYRDENLPEDVVSEQLSLHMQWADIYEEWQKEAGIDDVRAEDEKQEVEHYQSLLENAPKEPVVAGNYEANRFMGSTKGLRLVVDMKEGEPHTFTGAVDKTILIYPNSIQDVCHEQIRDYTPVEMNYTSLTAEMKNLCSMTREDARELAVDFLQDIGITEYVEQGVYGGAVAEEPGVVSWSGAYYFCEDGSAMPEKYIIDGYVFRFVSGVDGIPFEEGEGERSFSDISASEGAYSMRNRYFIYVNDSGVFRAELYNPLFSESTQPCSTLLDCSTIQLLIKDKIISAPDELEQHIGSFDELQFYTDMKLRYFRVSDKNNKNCYSYIPVWMLYHVNVFHTADDATMDHAILYNALDGTPVYLDEEW